MAYTLTAEAKLAASQNQKTPNLIIDVEDVGVFGYFQDFKTLKFDDGYEFDDPNLFFDTKVPNNDTYPFINKDKTTKKLTQQLNQDKGGTGSIPSMKVSLVDYRSQVTSLIGTKEILGKKANAYLSFAGLEHPKDSIRIFSGTVTAMQSGPGEYLLTIDNPDYLKRQELFIQYVDELTVAINDTDTTLNVRDHSNFIGAQAQLESFVRIDDEIMKVNLIGGNTEQFNTVTRGQLDTTAASHDIGTEITSVYRLAGNPIELALALMLSKNNFDEYYSTDTFSFVEVSSQEFVNSIIVEEFDIADERSITPGDIAEITGSNGVDGQYNVVDVGIVDGNFSYVTIDGNITAANHQLGTAVKFFSQYNTLPEGCKMNPDEVDIAQHLKVNEQFGAQFPQVDVKITDSINAKEFIETELYSPIAAYFLPRKGRASVGYTAPAIAGEGTITLNTDNLANASKIRTDRTVNKNFYNSIVYKYGFNIIADKFTDATLSISEDSNNRIRAGSTPLTIETKSYSSGDVNRNFFDALSLRLLDRYQFAATFFRVEPLYGIGYSVEVGDIVLVDGKELQIYDDKTGRRDTFERLMEVTNKDLDITTGNVSLVVTDTNFGLEGRYASIGPGSLLNSGSTTSRIKIKKSFGTGPLDFEFEKWADYVGETIQIRSEDFAYQESTTLLGIDEADTNFLLVDTLSVAPLEDYIVELAPYDETGDFAKLLHASFAPRVQIVSGADNFSFDVDPADIGKFFVGSILDIHKEDYSGSRAESARVSDITSNTITVESDLTFTPDNTYYIDKIGFSFDEGDFYIHF